MIRVSWYNPRKMRIRFEHEPREWNFVTIREITTRSEDSVSTVRPDAQYDTTRYEPWAIDLLLPPPLRCLSKSPKSAHAHTYKRQSPHAQYDTTRYEPWAMQCNRPTYGKPCTVRYDTMRTVSDRPTIHYIHVLYTPHSTYDPRFVLYFLGEYSMIRYKSRECRLQTEIFSSTPRGFSRYDPQFVLYFIGHNRIVLQILKSQTEQDTIWSDTYLWTWL
jgi:hypothetical protein